MAGRARRDSLVRHYVRWIGALTAAFGLLIIAAALALVLLPLAARSADDLAGLVVLSAQTWAELPPETRPAFEAELMDKHRLALRPGEAPQGQAHGAFGFYMQYIERALHKRGAQGHLVRDDGPGRGDWLWITLQAGGEPIGVGFSVDRVSAHPLLALAFVGLAGATLVTILAVWLARRVARPVLRMERAAAQLAAGTSPALLPETGPGELADLARHFNRMALQVRELVDARTTLLAGVSHDLRTPLARMRLALEMLTLKPDPQLIERLDRDIEEMNALIGQLLTLARGMAPEGRQRVVLAPWLHDRAALAAAPGSMIAVHCDPALALTLSPGILARILDNLLGNALRYAPGAIDVEARVVRDAGGPAVRLHVLDRGLGIPPEQMAQIWRPFQRLEASRSPRTGGYGLGLAVVEQLAKAQGWQVGMAPREGGGLDVWVQLGRPEPAPAESTTAQEAPA